MPWVRPLLCYADIRGNKRKLQKVYHRLLLGLSTFDFLSSCACFFSTWPIPTDSAGPVEFAVGTTATCVTQGFFIQLSIGGPLYNFCLAIYYLLVLKHRWTESKIKTIEKYFHFIPWTIGIVLATLPIPLEVSFPRVCCMKTVVLITITALRSGPQTREAD